MFIVNFVLEFLATVFPKIESDVVDTVAAVGSASGGVAKLQAVLAGLNQLITIVEAAIASAQASAKTSS